ncbi:MAG: exonuclease domain-containing protein [Desulfobacterales bacterium]|nr:exonuclease domain-containing protein [Desulfobacterales bacterium]
MNFRVKPKADFVWFVIVSTTVNIIIIATTIFLLRRVMGTAEKALIADLFTRYFAYFFIPAALLLAGYALVLEWFYNFFIRPLNRLKEETDLILTVNPSLRVQVDGSRDIAGLAEMINRNIDLYEALKTDVQKKIDHARAETEIEKNIFAAIVSELTEGVVICNAKGQILLCNQQAKRILSSLRRGRPEYKDADEEADQFVSIGRSLFSVIDRYLLRYAINDITTKLRSRQQPAVTSFVMVNKHQQMFRVEVVPILNSIREYGGFVFIIYNITAELENDARIILHLNSLISNVRRKVSAIRSSAELICEYPDITETETQQFLNIILKESKLLSGIINNQSDFNYSVRIKSGWPLIPTPVVELLRAIRGKVEKPFQIALDFEEAEVKESVCVDGYSFTLAVSFVLYLIANEAQCREFVCKTGIRNSSVILAVEWMGHPLKTETLQAWMARFPLVGKERLPLTLKEIFDNHDVEMVPASDRQARDVAYLHIFLPRHENLHTAIGREISIVAENRPEFYDFDLFNQPAEHPELNERLLTDITYTVFDTETTGLEPRNGDEIISIAAVRIVNLRLLKNDYFDQLVNPGKPPSRKSIQVHGLEPEMLTGRPIIAEVLPVFKRFAEDTVLIAHNAAFDMCLLNMQEEKTGVRIANPVLDTMLLSAVVHPTQSDHSLEEIAKRLGVEIINRHTALGDAMAAGGIFIKLVKLLSAQGINTLKDALIASKKTYLARMKY